MENEKEYWVQKGYNEIVVDFCKSKNIEFLASKLDKNNAKFVDPYFHSTLLHIACEEDSLEMVKLLLNVENSKEFVNAPDWNGDTALHIACYNGNLDIIKILLNCGADTEYANKDGKIPLIESLESSTENNNINLSEIFKLFYPKANPVLTEFV